MSSAVSIHAGSLRHRITFQQRSTVIDAYGGQSETWTDVATVWGAIEPASGAEKVAAQALQVEISHTVMVRHQPWMTGPKQLAAYRVVWGSRVFDLHAAIDIDERHRLVNITASEGITNG